jgi:hypothetical protein
MTFVYHGSCEPVQKIRADLVGADGEVLCASKSCNIAARYGDVISKFSVTAINPVTVSHAEWMSGVSKSIPELREMGYDLMIVSGADSFDFPVDTFFAIRPSALSFVALVSQEERIALDDGYADRHDPRPGEAGFLEYARDIYGSIQDAVEDDGWETFSDNIFRVEDITPDGVAWTGVITPDAGAWLVQSSDNENALRFEDLPSAVNELGRHRARNRHAIAEESVRLKSSLNSLKLTP